MFKNIPYKYMIILYTISIFSCKHKDTTSLPIKTLNTAQVETILFSSLVDSVVYYKLTPTTSSITSDIWKIRAYDQFIYLYSLSDMMVYVYNTSGEHISSIGYGSNISVNYPVDLIVSNNQELWIVDSRQEVKRFTLDGKTQLGLYTLPMQTTAIAHYSGNQYLLYDGFFDKTKQKHIAMVEIPFDDQSIAQHFLPKVKLKGMNAKIPSSLFTKSETDEVIYTLLPYNDTIYASYPRKKTPFLPLYHIDFEGKMLTTSLWPKGGYNDRSFSEMMESNQYIYSINSFYVARQMLFFRTLGKENTYYVINTSNHSLSKFEALFDGMNPKTTSALLGSDKEGLFLLFSAQELRDHFLKHEYKSDIKGLESLLENLTPIDELIVMKCILKQ